MNRIYRKVWNKELGQLVVASEFAKSDSAGVVQGEGSTAPLTRSLLAVVFASLFAVAGYGPAAFAQEWTVTDGATVNFQGDSNINVSVVADSDDATVEISLAPDLVVDSVTTGQTVMNNAGVAVGANVVLGTSGLSITGGPSVTLAGIDAGNKVITNVAAGGNASDAVNFGQLQGVESSALAAATAASVAQSTADNALTAAGNAQTTADAAVAAAGAGWDVSADSGSTANIGSGGSVAFSGDSNISVAQSGGDDAGAIDITLNPDLNVTSVTAGNTTVNNDGLTITGGPSVTASGIDAGGTKLTGLANGTVSADSTDAITGQQLHNVLFEGGSAFGVRYFRANSTADDAVAAGVEAVAIGPNTRAEGGSSFAAGDGAATSATAEGSIALGQGAVSGTEGGAVPDGDGSIAIGRDSQASGNRTVALGDGANIDSEYIEDGTALGAGATVSGNFSTGGTAVGANAVASAGNATALGTEAQASGSGSIAVGQAEATAGNSIAAGTGAYAATGDSIALGTGAGVGTEGLPGGDRTDHIAIGTAAGQNVQGNQSTAIGYGAGQGVVGDGNIALGVEAGRSLEGNNNISIGVNANDGAGGRAQAIAIGDRTAAGSDSVALGSGAKASGSETVALGKDAIAGANGVALGAHAEAQGSNIALGRNSAARESDVSGVGYLTGEAAPGNAVSVGNSNPGEAFQRRITNVSDGAQRYDAVNVGQLQSAQQSVANLVGGNVTVESNGSFGGYVIELQDLDGVSHQYATVAEAINAVSSGAISVLPGDAVIYNPNGTITVAEGVVDTDAVNVEQLNKAIAESGVKYFSANTTVDANRGNDGATADNAMAIGPAAVASGASSLAVGHAARVNAGAHNGVAIGHDVSARAENATVLGNRSHTYDAGGVAIGQQAVSRGRNSIVMGTGAEADPKSGQTVDNAIVIGTDAEATADDGIAVGQSALASEDRAVAQGYDAHAMAIDSQAFGTRARTTGVNSQASGTDAHASGVNAIATGTNARGYATDGIAMGTGAISGFVVDVPGDAVRNHGAIAIGDTSRADDLNAMALGVEAQARAESATAIGDSAVATEDAEDGLAVGSSARVTAQNASAFGQSAEAVAEDALAVGSGARAAGQSASAVGHGAEASVLNASAFGQGARALHEGSVALGAGAVTADANPTSSGTVNQITYGGFAGTNPQSVVSVGTAGAERQVTNVAAGRISATSTDAINGSQLFATQTVIGNVAHSTADVLGGNASVGPDGTITMDDVGGTGYDTVHDAIEYAAQGWDVSANGGTSANVAPGGSVDFSNNDENIVIARSDTNLTFDLADDLVIGNSLTIGDTYIDGDSITTNNLTVEGDTILGDHFTVNEGGVYYDGPITEGDHIVNKTYVDGAVDDLANRPLTFAGDAGADVDRILGETVNLVGGATDEAALTDGNIGVVANGDDTLEIKLNKDIDLGADGSLTIGDAELDNDGLTVVDADGNETTVGADGTAVTDVDGNRTDVGAGTITVADAAGETVIGGNQVSVGGDNPIVISGDTGTIGGLTNRTFDPDDITNGQAATEDQLGSVYEVANAGWNVSAQGENATNVGVNSETGNAVDLNNADGNIVITKADDSNDVTFDLADVLQIEESIEVGGNTFIDGDGIAVGDDVHLGDTGLVIGDADGPRFTNAGISAGDQMINDVADGVADTDAVNVRQLEANRTKYYSVNDNGVVQGNYDNDGATGVNALAAGVNTQAEGANSVAIGSGAVASSNVGSELLNPIGGNTNASTSGDFAVAIGYEARALGDQTIAVGRFAGTGAMGSNNVLLGARAGEDSETSNNIFLGERAGSGLAADPDGNEGAPFLRGHNVGVGMDTLQGGHGENNTALGLRAGRWQEGSSNTHVGSFAGVAQHGDFNVNAGYFAGQYTDSRGSVNIGVEAGAGSPDERVAADYAVSIGYQAKALADGALAVGQGAQALNGNDVALGAGSVTAAANPTSEGTVGDITYGGFAGDTPESVVSVGDVGAERQVTNVAAGRISEDSTDAINGSQLFATQTVIGNVAGSVVNVFGGNAELGDDGTITMTDIGGTGENTIHDAIKTANDTANMGWHVAVGGEGASDGNNVGPGGLVDFSNDDGNIVISRDGTDLAFNLAENIDLGENGSLTTGNTVVNNDGLTVEDEDGNVNTVAADGTTVADADGNTTAIGAGTVAVTDGTGTTTIGGNAISVGGANPILISGDTGTIGGLQNQTIGYQGFADGSGRAATEEQLAQVNDTANMGWNISAQGGNGTNVGPGGSVDLSNTDGNIVIAKEDDSNDVTFDLADDLVIGNSITAGDTYIDTTGVAIGADVHLGHTGLVITGGPSVTVAGIDAGNLVITNVAPGEISATSTDAINGSQLHGMGDSIVNVIGGNAELNPDGTITTSDIGGTGHDNIDDAIRAANDAANAGWTATDADGNAANIGPNGSVNFTGDGNISVAQTGDDNSGEIEITLNRDLDVDSITAGDTVIDTDGVRVGDDVHLGDTGLVIEGGPSVTTDGIDAGGSTITNVAAGVNDTDAVNVGQLNQVAGDVNDLGDRMDVVEGDVADLQAGATGPFQVSQEAPLVPPTPTGANSAAGGSGADASGDNSTALGNQAVASGDNSTAVGQGAQATHDNSVALGQGSATTVGAQSGYDAAYVGSSDSAGEVNVGNRTITGVAPGVAGTDAVNVNQLNAGVNHAVVTANEYTDQRVNQVQSDVWHLHGRVDDLEKSINSGVATAMAMRQAPYVAGATTYFAGFGAYKDQGALGVSMRRTADNGRWSLEGGFSANRDGAGGYIGVSGVLGSK